MNHDHGSTHTGHSIDFLMQFLLSAPFFIGIVLYISAIIVSTRRGRPWGSYRTALWVVGSLLCLITLINPMITAAHENFTIHMFAHLLLGMLGPLLMVLGAPFTLLLRALSTGNARKVTAFLKKPLFHFLSNPAVPAVLNIGGLWILYTTQLYILMETMMWVHVLVHLHVFLAGYFFAATLLYIDPIPYQYSYIYRSMVLILALAGHKILSKYIYAYPPEGVPRVEAESGGMLMYYGGDAVDLIIIIILCYKWYQSKNHRKGRYPVTA
ncbi:hypothetical protein CR194_09190 [Salipaludibacillus keqinensis]|uniref:Cytochrome c oxidase assembly protein n=1 Tax=Salipaludibacillus keqinensis TaxID=2045207 RepID=A0A323THF6_9BACI|nr:cytochrome c oxidase assembly protein [Salipaludibacillus keqinensis]PYZ93354.1 hypothetical protein CR194_09190 [Salipaludibacillus keqinensis]